MAIKQAFVVANHQLTAGLRQTPHLAVGAFRPFKRRRVERVYARGPFRIKKPLVSAEEQLVVVNDGNVPSPFNSLFRTNDGERGGQLHVIDSIIQPQPQILRQVLINTQHGVVLQAVLFIEVGHGIAFLIHEQQAIRRSAQGIKPT